MLRRHDLTPDVHAAGAIHRYLVIALLVWVQVLGPFVHAHSGSARVGGWHVHTAIPLAVAGLEADALASEAWRQAPEGPDAPEVGVAAGLPQPRNAMASLPAGTADDAVCALLTAWFGELSAPQAAVLHGGVAAEPPPRGAGRPGLPALAHAPPIS